MHSIEVYEVVKKLVGSIVPVGETNEDDRRFDNLKVMTDLVNRLLTDIDYVAYNHKDSYEFSRKRAGKFASEFFDEIGVKE